MEDKNELSDKTKKSMDSFANSFSKTSGLSDSIKKISDSFSKTSGLNDSIKRISDLVGKNIHDRFKPILPNSADIDNHLSVSPYTDIEQQHEPLISEIEPISEQMHADEILKELKISREISQKSLEMAKESSKQAAIEFRWTQAAAIASLIAAFISLTSCITKFNS